MINFANGKYIESNKWLNVTIKKKGGVMDGLTFYMVLKTYFLKQVLRFKLMCGITQPSRMLAPDFDVAECSKNHARHAQHA